MRIRAVPEAIDETREIRASYRKRNRKAARDFQTEYAAARARIARWPMGAPEIGSGLRAMRLSTFPYLVLYRLQPGLIEIVAIAHAKREPGYWLRR